MSDVLKSNTTLMQVGLCCEDKRNNANGIHQQFTLSINIKSTDNKIGERGATSLSDALKSNSTLTELDLSRAHKRNNTQMASINDPLFHSHQTGNSIGDRGATSLSDALKANTTLTKLDLGGEYKRNGTQVAFINNPLFSSNQQGTILKKEVQYH